MKCIRPICTSLTYQIQGAKSIYVNVRIGKKCKRTVKLTKGDKKYFLTNTYVSCSITLMFKVFPLSKQKKEGMSPLIADGFGMGKKNDNKNRRNRFICTGADCDQ